MRRPLLLCALAVAGGCAGEDRDPVPALQQPRAPAARTGTVEAERRAERPRVFETARVRCEVGARPRYFVPKTPDSPLALLGCARLGASGKRVEFSGSVARIGRERHSCINPAYRRGAFIPAICALRPPLPRFAVHDAAQPRQAVRGYGYVIWGSAGTADRVLARFHGGRARAAILEVPERLARRFGESPFRIFVAELPPAAACAPVTVVGDGRRETIRPGSRACRLPTACRSARPGFSPQGHVTSRAARRPCSS